MNASTSLIPSEGDSPVILCDGNCYAHSPSGRNVNTLPGDTQGQEGYRKWPGTPRSWITKETNNM